MNTKKTWTKSDLWTAMCKYKGEFTLSHAESVLKYFDCDECPGRVGAECDECPIKKAETVRINHLWKMAADTHQYCYKTDGESGIIQASSIEDARDKMIVEAGLTKAAIKDGGWGWVEDCDGVRIYVAEENI
jgi:hypothetical protein